MTKWEQHIWNKFVDHIGHQLEIVTYNNEEGETINLSLKCIDCFQVLLDIDA